MKLKNDPTEKPIKSSKTSGDKIEVIKILVIMIASFVLGFGLVILFLAPSSTSHTNDPTPPPEQAPLAVEMAAAGPSADTLPTHGGSAPEPASAATGGYAPPATLSEEGDEATRNEGDAPAEVPPGRTPEGVAMDGSAFYLKCWSADGTEVRGPSCDRLSVFEKRFSTRLYVIDKCKQRHARSQASGKLSVGVEVDFENWSLSFWNGASSDLENAGQIATCLRTELSGLPVTNIDHKHNRYRLFFTVLFGKNANQAEKKPVAANAPSKGGKGKLTEVVKNRVRVRRAPKDGEIIGMINAGNQVQLVEEKAGWCQVITPNNNEGWMICDALSK